MQNLINPWLTIARKDQISLQKSATVGLLLKSEPTSGVTPMFQGTHMAPAKAKCGQTDKRTDKVIPMWIFASLAPRKK